MNMKYPFLVSLLWMGACATRLDPMGLISPYGSSGSYIIELSGTFMGSGTHNGTPPEPYHDSEFLVIKHRMGVIPASEIKLYHDDPGLHPDDVWRTDVVGQIEVSADTLNVQLQIVGISDGIKVYHAFKCNGTYSLRDGTYVPNSPHEQTE